jgi:hypothetical protein
MFFTEGQTINIHELRQVISVMVDEVTKHYEDIFTPKVLERERAKQSENIIKFFQKKYKLTFDWMREIPEEMVNYPPLKMTCHF